MTETEDTMLALYKLLQHGLSVNNVRQMEKLSMKLLLAGIYPTVFYVLESIFFELVLSWQDTPLAPEEYEYMQRKLAKPLDILLTAIIDGANKMVVAGHLDLVVSEFVDARSRFS